MGAEGLGARIVEGGRDGATYKAVLDGLHAHHAAATGAPPSFTDVILAAYRDGAAAPVGGLIGQIGFGWLFVRLFFLPEDLRGQGLGSALLAQAEAAARAHGCVGVHLDTFSFQARGFYERQGYGVIGTLADCPPGHERYYLAKRLDGEAPACST